MSKNLGHSTCHPSISRFKAYVENIGFGLDMVMRLQKLRWIAELSKGIPCVTKRADTKVWAEVWAGQNTDTKKPLISAA